VTISTEIEYRVGGYFVLAVNVNTIEWTRLIKVSRKDLLSRFAKWEREQRAESSDDNSEQGAKKNIFARWLENVQRAFALTSYDMIAYFFAFLYHFHWTIYLPMCVIAYRTPLGRMIDRFIVASAIDEIVYYVEEKGMEMEIRVCKAQSQASFMLSALREIRADGRELKKKRQETEQQEGGRPIIGPLLGPAIKEDKGPAVEPPGFEMPSNLDYVGLDLTFEVGFRRLRRAFLDRKGCAFFVEAFWKDESKYENITIGDWTEHNEYIGSPTLPPTINQEAFIGSELEASYLMPKSAFVNANMVYETSRIVEYNEFCFSVLTRSKDELCPSALCCTCSDNLI